MLRRPLCAIVLVALLVVGCGGSGHSSSSTVRPASTSSTTAATALHSTSTGTISAGPTTTTATTSARPPEVPKNRAPKRGKPTAPSSDVRIPAAFTIHAGEAVTPPLISAPPDVTIQLQMRNEDSRPHRVRLSVAHFSGLEVPAHGTAMVEVTGVRKGTYRLLVDGAAKARILVGAVPGP